MGNVCPEAETAHLASIARSICPFPEYQISPHFKFLGANSSQLLSDYQRNVSLQQGYMFNQGLKKIYGNEGKVTNGGMGVVALSLAVLFDTLARELKGECVPKSGPIPGLFLEEGDYYNPFVSVISEYVRLVPSIANNPTRMREETERYYRKLIELKNGAWCPKERLVRDVTFVNSIHGLLFIEHLKFHLAHLTNSSVVQIIQNQPIPRIDSCDNEGFVYSLNCEPVAANKEFLTEVEKNSQAKEELRNCQKRDWITGRVIDPKGTQLEHVASLAVDNAVFNPGISMENIEPEDYDLKANTVDTW